MIFFCKNMFNCSAKGTYTTYKNFRDVSSVRKLGTGPVNLLFETSLKQKRLMLFSLYIE